MNAILWFRKRTGSEKKRVSNLVVVAVIATFFVTAGSGVDYRNDGVSGWKEHISETCESDIAVLGARGSGEGKESGRVSGFGGKLSPFAQALATNLHDDVGLSFLAVPYPAAPGWTPLVDIVTKEYSNSVAWGVGQVLNKAKSIVQYCDSTQIFLMGYSQGAEVMQRVLASLNERERERVLAAVLVANPVVSVSDQASLLYTGQLEADAGVAVNVMTPLTTKGGWVGGVRAGKTANIPDDMAGRVIQVCSPGDEICNNDGKQIREGIDHHKRVYKQAELYEWPIINLVNSYLSQYTERLENPSPISPEVGYLAVGYDRYRLDSLRSLPDPAGATEASHSVALLTQEQLRVPDSSPITEYVNLTIFGDTIGFFGEFPFGAESVPVD